MESSKKEEEEEGEEEDGRLNREESILDPSGILSYWIFKDIDIYLYIFLFVLLMIANTLDRLFDDFNPCVHLGFALRNQVIDTVGGNNLI